LTVQDVIRDKLSHALSPTRMDIVNESHLHAGHSGSPGTGDSHFRVEVVSARFAGLNRIERQRLVYQTLADEIAGPVHALALSTLTPEEDP